MKGCPEIEEVLGMTAIYLLYFEESELEIRFGKSYKGEKTT